MHIAQSLLCSLSLGGDNCSYTWYDTYCVASDGNNTDMHRLEVSIIRSINVGPRAEVARWQTRHLGLRLQIWLGHFRVAWVTNTFSGVRSWRPYYNLMSLLMAPMAEMRVSCRVREVWHQLAEWPRPCGLCPGYAASVCNPGRQAMATMTVCLDQLMLDEGTAWGFLYVDYFGHLASCTGWNWPWNLQEMWLIQSSDVWHPGLSGSKTVSLKCNQQWQWRSSADDLCE